MNSMLLITNGDSAVNVIKSAGIAGEYLPWRDSLHEGPVPSGHSLEELSNVRAHFLSRYVTAEEREILNSFYRRDETLKRFHRYETVVLLFEHDLYDQLQLLQLLHWFSQQDLKAVSLQIVCHNEFLGCMTSDRLAQLFEERETVSLEQLQQGYQAWEAFRSPDPRSWLKWSDRPMPALPYLQDAAVRHLQQFPSLTNGLNRTETATLQAVREGVEQPMAIFQKVHEQEESPFMGDCIFWQYLLHLSSSPSPLLQIRAGSEFRNPEEYPDMQAFNRQKFTLTEHGKRILSGNEDGVRLQKVDKWLGGVHLQEGNIWRWDNVRCELVLDSGSIGG